MTNRTPLPRKPFNPTPVWLSAWIAVLWLIVVDLDISFQALAWGLADIGEYFGRYGDPDFSDLSRYLKLLAQTIATAIWGTFFALVVAFALAPFAARNLTTGPRAYRIAREILSFMRAMPDLLLALIFVAAMGLGPLPGSLALGVHTAGFLGKFFAESLERVDPGVIEAVRAVGGDHTQVVMYAGWPSILREALGYTLYIMDRNVRMAAVLGLVGAGGIGLALHDTLRLFKYDESAALIAVILATLLAFDYLSTWLRGKLQ
ncbi:phosphonate ABC transporter, permease protein PhnE [Sedimenticola hydrogenitrophicus]|uniref:phosphonate ABC transporter, permease protein PhnE n=1 Tax=Sedimenticola hydrogenitrophicus TaxID=2967975 RepID=UPI0023B1F3CF|nr:phosphonate ABC transporter, permease protein PhnE [Sedimenticola hydrogenitrophicus]